MGDVIWPVHVWTKYEAPSRAACGTFGADSGDNAATALRQGGGRGGAGRIEGGVVGGERPVETFLKTVCAFFGVERAWEKMVTWLCNMCVCSFVARKIL